MHVAREVVPGLPVADYVSHDPAWLAASRRQERVILSGLRARLQRSDNEAVASVTIRPGAESGLVREAYYGGWRVVEQLRHDGMSLAQIARVPEAEMPDIVGRAMDELLSSPSVAH